MLEIQKYFWWYLGVLVLGIFLLLSMGYLPISNPFIEGFEEQKEFVKGAIDTCPDGWIYIEPKSKTKMKELSDLAKELLLIQSKSQFQSRFNKAFEDNPSKDTNNNNGYSPHEPVQQTNKGSEPWNHHPIQSILNDPVLQYPNIYANEMDNITFERTLIQVFSIPETCPGKWSSMMVPNEKTPESILKAYSRALNWIQSKLKSTKAFDLCADTEHYPLQVVHDVWTGYQTSLKGSSYKIQMETILYRESKFIGKHVRFQIIVQGTRVSVCEALVLGVVYEDQIALFPVVASDPADDRLWGKFPSVVLEPEPTILLQKKDIQTILQTYRQKQYDEAKAYQAVSGKNINDYIIQPSSIVRPAPEYVKSLPPFLQPLQEL